MCVEYSMLFVNHFVSFVFTVHGPFHFFLVEYKYSNSCDHLHSECVPHIWQRNPHTHAPICKIQFLMCITKYNNNTNKSSINDERKRSGSRRFCKRSLLSPFFLPLLLLLRRGRLRRCRRRLFWSFLFLNFLFYSLIRLLIDKFIHITLS